MKAHFVYERGDHRVTFTGFCGGPAEARALREAMPMLCGVPWVQEQDAIEASIEIERLEEAIETLESAGFATVDGDARDFDAAHQDWDSGEDAPS
jgi:hypothetical protein